MMPRMSTPSSDIADAFPEVRGWRLAARAGDVGTLEKIYRELPDEASRSFAVSTFAAAANVEELGRAAAAPAATVFTQLLYAAGLVHAGWEIRSAKRARYVSQEQFAAFHDHLRRAEQILIDVTAREPEHSAAWRQRLVTARGLELGQSEARRRYQRNAAYHPDHIGCEMQLLQQLCPKWGGSWEAAFGFARERAATAPEGSPSAVLVAEAHLEQWMDDKDARGRIRQPDVQSEIADAAHRSVLSPHYRRDYAWVTAHSTFALAFSLGGNDAAAAPHYAALGDVYSEHPWGYVPEPAASFLAYRKAAAKAAGGTQ